jgi:hypothetical protein
MNTCFTCVIPTSADYVVEGAGDISTEPNTVEAKSVEEIQARLEQIEKAKKQE